MSNNIIAFSKHSRFPDVDLDRVRRAVDLAWADGGAATAQDVASRALRNLPGTVSDFERGIVAGIVLARSAFHHASPSDAN
jgi:hypothetical protein